MNAPDLPQIHERVDYWLNQWARFMRHPGIRLGYPNASLIFANGGESQRWADWADDEEERIWKRSVKAMDAAINDLAPAQRIAIHHTYLGVTAQFPRDNLFELLEQAASYLLIAMHKRDIL